MPDKKKVAEKIAQCLKDGGMGLIMTKNPLSLGRRISSCIRPPKTAHTAQIRPEEFKKILADAGLKEITIYPGVVFFPPVKHIFSISRYLWRKLYKKPLGWLGKHLCESYIITFSR